MNQTRKKHARTARLPLAVIAAGSLALGGVTSSFAMGLPNETPVHAPLSLAKPAADAPPIYEDKALNVAPKGEEAFTVNYELSDPPNGIVVLNDTYGVADNGEKVWLSSSTVPNTGSILEARYENGKVVYNGPRDHADAYSSWTKDSRQISFSVSTGEEVGPDLTHWGGTYYASSSAVTLETSEVEKRSGTPLLPVGSSQWTFDLPAGVSWLESAKVSIFYYSDSPDAPEGGFVDLELSEISISNGKLTVSDEVISQLTAGDSYQVYFVGPGESESATVYMGLYGEAPEPTPTPTPTEEPTSEPTEEPTSEPTEEPTAEPTETTEPTSEPTSEPTEEPTSEPTSEPTDEPTAEPTEEPTDVPEAEEPESGEQVAPGEEYLAFDSESSSVEDGTYVFTTKSGVEDGDVAVTYRTSPGAKPQTIEGRVENGKLTITADEAFTGSISDHNQLLVSVKGSDGRVISALLSGANV